MATRILFVHNYPTKFAQTDLALLRERYSVCEWYQRGRAVNLSLLTRAVAANDLVFGWFASWHTLFPVLIARILRRPSILVIGGYDTANLPEIGYGSQRGGVKRWVTRLVMKLSTRLVAFSEFSRQEAIRNAEADPGKLVMVYIGVQDRGHGETKEPLVMTAGNIDRGNLHRKGLEPFVRTAALLPHVPFVLVGSRRDSTMDHLRSIASPNVTLTGWVSDQELQDYFSQAKVYVQASRHEGFGLAVAEAMLCGCIPVVTCAGSLPEVVGNAGLYVDMPEPAAIADRVRVALNLGEEWSQRARERILCEFPLQRRQDGLSSVIRGVLNQRV